VKEIYFGQPRNYSEMLTKIGQCTFVFAFACTFIIGMVSDSASLWLKSFLNIQIPLLGLGAMYIVIPSVIAVLFRVVKMHNIVSHLFNIRKRFEYYEILSFLCAGSGSYPTLVLYRKLNSNERRREVMNATFYKYADAHHPIIDNQLIITALDKWCWFWVVLELMVLLLITSLVLLLLMNYSLICIPLCLMLLLVWVLGVMLRQNASAAHEEVQAILSDPQRKLDVCTYFNAL
jgi:hypothetical protein